MHPSILHLGGGTRDPVFPLTELTLKWREQLTGDDSPWAMLRDVEGVIGIYLT